jgi:hypothetical protein
MTQDPSHDDNEYDGGARIMRTPEEQVAFMLNPDRWPNWTLPLKRYRETEHRMDFAILSETEVLGVFKFVRDGGDELEQVGDAKMVEALVNEGWRVD